MTKLPVHKTLCCLLLQRCHCLARSSQACDVSGVLHYCQGQWDNKGALWLTRVRAHTHAHTCDVTVNPSVAQQSCIHCRWGISHSVQSYSTLVITGKKECSFPSYFQSASIRKSIKTHCFARAVCLFDQCREHC